MAVSQTNVAMDVPTYYTLKIVDKYMVYEITSASLYSSGDIHIHGVVLEFWILTARIPGIKSCSVTTSLRSPMSFFPNATWDLVRLFQKFISFVSASTVKSRAKCPFISSSTWTILVLDGTPSSETRQTLYCAIIITFPMPQAACFSASGHLTFGSNTVRLL